MKKVLPHWITSIVAALFLSTGLVAQEQVEVSVQVTKDGKVVKDTTYLFEDASGAKHALKMMQVMSGDGEHMEHITYNYTSSLPEGRHSRAMVFISEDGETTEIKEIHEDSLAWITEKEVDGDHVKVMKYRIKEGEEPHGEKVIIMKSEDGGSFDILLDEDSEDVDVVKKKQVKVVVSDDEDIRWHVEGDEMIYDRDDNVYIIKGDDDVKLKVMKIMEDEGDGENVKVIVIEKDDEDHDVDVDLDHDEDVDVKVVKKKIKK
jgi:hypothetical protein